MYLLLAFAVALLIAVYLSGLAERSPVSTSVLFLVAGFIVGPGVLNLIFLQPGDPGVDLFVKIALVIVLFTDGMEINAREFRSIWKLPGRALFLGLPITMVIMAVLAYLMIGVTWAQAFLIAAVLSPTDPVFASMLVNQPAVPEKLRQLLNVESGVNDGLALPIILTVLAFMNVEKFELLSWVGELLSGVFIGIAVTWAAFTLAKVLRLKIAEVYRPLLALSVGLLVYVLADLLHGNHFLASFSAGVTTATFAPDFSADYLKIGKPFSELSKLAGLLIFGSLLSISFFEGVTFLHLLFGLLVLLLARPIGLNLSLLGSSLTWKERLAASWFGPRGFASVLYSLLIYRSAALNVGFLVRIIALVILLSITLHTTTDSFATHLFKAEKAAES